MTTAPPAATRVLAQIAALQRMDAKQLYQQWEATMDGPPPGSAASLRQRLIHRIQELAYGGLAPAVKATLDKVARRDTGEERPAEKASIPGTRFIREWHGHRHEVTVVADGFEYLGKRYRSLRVCPKINTSTCSGNVVYWVHGYNHPTQREV